MRPSPPPPALGDFPSSPSSAWSCTPSVAQYPPTPIDSMERLLPQHPKTDSCFLSDDDVPFFLRNRDRWENMYDRFESSPPPRPRNSTRVRPVSQDRAADDFSWEATHIVDSTGLADPSRCSLLIHEVSLLVGLAPDDDFPLPDDSGHFVPDRPKHVPDILPLTLTPTKCLASRKHAHTTVDATAHVHPSNIPIFPSINPRSDDPNPALHFDKVRPTGIVIPPARHKNTDGVRTPVSSRRRQGQVFDFQQPLSDPPHQNAADLDDTFIHPRDPPPKPTAANRCSSLDRLEHSLQKLEAHAPRKHRKSQSEERPPHHIAQSKDKRPSLPPPRRLRKGHSSHEIMSRSASRPAHPSLPSESPPPVPRPILVRQQVAPVPLDEELAPGSFMDMDIPCTEETSQKGQASFRQLTSKEKMKSLVKAAKRASRGVIAWGKNLTPSTKP